MEVKEAQGIQELMKTTEGLTWVVEHYRKVSEEISRLELSKKVAREAILEKFREMQIRSHDTDSGLRARVHTQKLADRIDVKEAEVLLDADTFEKLIKRGNTIAVLSVRPIKAEEEQDA